MTPAARSALLRRLLIGAVAMAIVAALATAMAPGYVRLVALQPARDLLFFQREIEPLRHYAAIERHAPSPDGVEKLSADPAAGHDIELVLDVWTPAVTPAPAVLLLHGSSPRGRKLGFNKLLAERLRQSGWLVLTPDLRGFGRSGMPGNPTDPAAWSVHQDLVRLVSYARRHPAANGTVVAVGHSLGGSHLLQLDDTAAELAAVVLIGPSRDAADDERSWWRRVRFSADRGIARPIPPEVAVAAAEWSDLVRFAADRPPAFRDLPILLMDGEREGERRIAVLREAALLMQPDAVHVTVPDAHHYCGVYQLPWPMRQIYLRPDVFERCFEPLAAFLSAAAAQAR
jgi:pimeloyl-ACP methyl ester carboxylesterase